LFCYKYKIIYLLISFLLQLYRYSFFLLIFISILIILNSPHLSILETCHLLNSTVNIKNSFGNLFSSFKNGFYEFRLTDLGMECWIWVHEFRLMKPKEIKKKICWFRKIAPKSINEYQPRKKKNRAIREKSGYDDECCWCQWKRGEWWEWCRFFFLLQIINDGPVVRKRKIPKFVS
jgi:hypothetical protein